MQYFKHYTNMRHDIKIDRLISKYGLEGYGLYVLILECIADKLTSLSPIPDLEETSEDMARKYKIDTIKTEEIILFCINQGLFDLDEISGRIVCHKMYKFLDSSMTGSPELRKMIQKYKSERNGVTIYHDDVMKHHEESGSVSTEENIREENIRDKNRVANGKKDKSQIVYECDYFVVTKDKYFEFQKTYKYIDLINEFDRMRLWLDANPAKQKSDYPRFVTNWLSRMPKVVPPKSIYPDLDGIK